MDYTFKDLVDLGKLRKICEYYTDMTKAVTAILDIDGNVLIATGWQDVCTQFHRVSPETARRCTESDTILAGQLKRGEKYSVYICKNGLVDVAVPIIVEGRHVGNLFTGQFFFEPPDLKFFRRQAALFHFDEKAYLEAVSRVPIFTKEQVKRTTDFLCYLSEIIGEMGLARLTLLQINNELSREIQERKQTEDILEKQTALLNNILNNIPLEIAWKNREGFYMGCNKAFAEAVHLERPEAVIGKADDFQGWGKEDADVLKTGNSFLNVETSISQPDGQKKTLLTSKVPLKDPQGSVFGILGINIDITERVRMEELLRQSQKMESLGTLAGGIAHEFNNILAGILGYVEIAQDEAPADSPVRERVAEIGKLCVRGRDLVKQILSFSHKGKPEWKAVRPNVLIRDELRVLRAAIPANIEIQADIDDRPAMVMGDATQLQQIGMNLCMNAAHAMREKGGVLTIGLSNVSLDEETVKMFEDIQPGRYVQLTVGDTGSGIDPGIIGRIFEPFFTTKEVGQGTGMGLAMVHGIIKNHGGAISVASRPGQGSTFTVVLPRAKVDAAEEETKDITGLAGGRERILIVDDEKSMVFSMKIILERLGYTVTALSESSVAVELFRKKPDDYDLIISDLTMPVLTGDMLAAEVVSIRPDIPVLIATGYSDAVDSDRLRKCGVRAFISKPFKKKELATTIRAMLDAQQKST